ncbi:MAG TPA: hypothetical protein VG406_09560 [Isosphaeraceae bacterium]|nr:hypothetical protein [Isosphaeraceae bacterium]
MVRARVSIAGLLTVVLVSAVGLAALNSASDLWTSLVTTGAFAVLGYALVGAAVGHGRSRAYWIGFAIFGFGYLALASGPESRRRLMTTRILDSVARFRKEMPKNAGDRLVAERQGETLGATVLEVKDGKYKVNFDGWTSYYDEWIGPDRIRAFVPDLPKGNGKSIVVGEFEGNHQVIGHALLALVAGALGGWLAIARAPERNNTATFGGTSRIA